MTRIALTIAGSDPSGGAGIQADLKTFHQRQVYGTSVLTLLTVQNTQGVRKVEFLPPQLVAEQLDAVLEDLPPHAAKTGALGNAEIIRVVARKLRALGVPLVVDPVMISKHGAPLIAEEARSTMIECLFPLAFLVTPNLNEAAALSGMPVRDLATMQQAATKIASSGACAVLIKGGHLTGDAIDLLYWKNEFRQYSACRVDTVHTHGTGCTYSAAITAELAKGQDLPEAVSIAKRFITEAIKTNPHIGKGFGPVNHHAEIDPP
jgi:hydroxymethylpyrimidine/phosphomethylpyrimidine kinase